MKLIECVPNFSEGRNENIIQQITDSITSTGAKVLHIDMGKDTNRTVVTFVGSPEQVLESAFLSIQKAALLIDMRQHSGTHPRMGATDVCPFVPISNVTMAECVVLAQKLAQRVANELQIPTYLYEYAQPNIFRNNLSKIREGEYEGLFLKMQMPEWLPDFSAEYNAKSGATIIGARNFLIAYNVNLNTTSTRRANAVAFDIREQGRIIKQQDGTEIRKEGQLKHVKAIGWYLEEQNCAQVSINITNIIETPIFKVFEACCLSAQQRGLRVTGSELIGLIPKQSLIDAGQYFLHQQQRI